MKKLVYISTAVLIVALLVGVFCPVHGETELYDKVLRLHVLANSDSEADQALKLKVRDTVIETLTPLVKDLQSIEEVKETAESSLELIEARAEETVRAEGYSYDVTVTLTREDYPTKSYDSMCFPAGEYTSLRVMIGEAEGQNWWCVLFPPLCLSAATSKADNAANNKDAFISAGLTDDQYNIVTETQNTKYKVRFRILEIIEGVFKK